LTRGDGACAMPSYSANIAASKDLQEQAPEFVDLLRDLRISIEEMEQMQKQVDIDGQDLEVVSRQWIDEHAGHIDAWIG
jgi:glycine betaine/proline transport system substrate-binding protein